MAGERDGNWLDPSGCCKICDGEIPHGHTDNCDIWKLEQQLAAERERAEKAEELIRKMDSSEKDFETSYWRCLADLEKAEGQLFTINKTLADALPKLRRILEHIKNGRWSDAQAKCAEGMEIIDAFSPT